MDELRGDLDSFKNDVIRFNSIDEQIKVAEAKIKPIRENILSLKKEKLELKNEICIYMDDNEFDQCDLPNNGSITFKKRKTIIPVSKQSIREDLNRFFCVGPGKESSFSSKTDIQKATDIYEFLYNNRDYKLTNTLTTKK
jgi:uncharacterized protein YdcH (DUF465 family)